MIKLTAPEGYKLQDIRTNKLYSEVVINEKDRKHFKLVPDNVGKITEYIGG